MNDNVEIIRSNKGGMKIIHRGYMYTVHKKRQGGGIRWRCTQRSLHCKGSISTGNGPPSVNMPHNHIPDPHSVALARCRQIEDYPDINSLLETEYEDIKDSMPLQQRIAVSSTSSSAPPMLQIPLESRLHSQPLSPTKLKVTRQMNKSPLINQKNTSETTASSSEEVCLRWNSHHSNMQTAFPNLLQKEQYVDVTLMAEGKTIKCHRMILSSCSTYFEEVLEGITPIQHPVIILNHTPFWILKALIDFMYIGEVNIDQNQLPELLDIAELLKIKGLAGKSSAGETDKKDNSTTKTKQPPKEIPPSKPIAKKFRSPSPKLEDSSPINDPLELLEPTFQEETPPEIPVVKIKEKQFHAKKFLAKKLKKRKAAEHESTPPPLFPMRRGTRSRPNVKMPRYYDYEDIVKPTGSQSIEPRPFSPINIKSEPMDEDEVPAQECDAGGGLVIEAKGVGKEVQLSSTFCKIKIKSLSSLAENPTDPLSDKLPALEISAVNVSVSKELPDENNDKSEDQGDSEDGLDRNGGKD